MCGLSATADAIAIEIRQISRKNPSTMHTVLVRLSYRQATV